MADSKTETPERFEHYRVITDAAGKPVKLGEGAMGVTYLAEDTNLRVKVALKVIAPSLLGDAEIVHRFQREAQAAARLRHPNVAAVYHLGTVDNTFFYTMEFVEGRTLREHVATNGPLSMRQALEVTLQICEALGAAEKHQMVHRDIKPANIMLETTEDGLHAKLIDFGLAKPLQHDAQQTSALLTQRGTFLGTAVFASPEQVQDHPLDTRSDFYALGLTLWVMVEGRPPYEGSLHKVLFDQVHTKPPLDRLMWVPVEVRSLLEKLLEKDPSARPQTARDLRRMLHDCLRAVDSNSSRQSDWQQRFQVSLPPRPQPWGSIYEGQDSLSGSVWLHFLRNDRFHDAEAANRFVSEVRRSIEVQHPNVLRHLTIFPSSDSTASGWMVVTEHPGTHTLLGHLQRVKQLPAHEALPLMTRLAEALDCCLANDLLGVDLQAARIYLKPQPTASEDAPIEVVPKLFPIDYSAVASLQSMEDTALGLTQMLPRREVRTSRDAVQKLATLTYQCLGGSWGRLHRYVPLPALTQKQNEVLREALTDKPHTRALDFVEALQQAKVPRRPAGAPVTEVEATVTLSPWERLAALASPTLTQEGTLPGATSRSTLAGTEPEIPATEETSSLASATTPPDEMAASLASPEESTPSSPLVSETVLPEEASKRGVIEAALPPDPMAQELPVTAPAVSPPTERPSASEPPPSEKTPAIQTKAVELQVQGHSTTGKSTKATTISALRDTMEREWRDAKPILDKVASPVRDTITTLPRWLFITVGCFVATVVAAVWMIANRNVGKDDLGKTKDPVIGTADAGGNKTISTPPPPPPTSLDQLLQAGIEAANQGDPSALFKTWQDISRRFPDKWNGPVKSTAFISAVTKAWMENKLGDSAKAVKNYLPILSASARNNDVALLTKLSVDLQEDGATAEPFEHALLKVLGAKSEAGGLEKMLDESLRLVKLRKSGNVAQRARDLIRQTLDPLVAIRERKPRPEDQTESLRNAYQALAPKLEALSSIDEPSALFLYGDKLKEEGKPKEAMKAFARASELGHLPSMLKYGLMLSNQTDKATSMPQAVHWFKMADAKGYAQATLALGECYLFGSGTAQDYDLALQCLNTAASKDIAEAHYLLGSTYLGIKPGGDENTSFDPAKLAPEVTGNARLKKARGHLEKAWSRGQPLAGVLLAQMLLGGLGGDKDFKGGVEILDQAVQLPPADAYALRNLALIYSDEDVENLPTPAERRAAGVKANPERAKQLMKQAAELGLPEARQWCEEKGIKY